MNNIDNYLYNGNDAGGGNYKERKNHNNSDKNDYVLTSNVQNLKSNDINVLTSMTLNDQKNELIDNNSDSQEDINLDLMETT